MSVNIAARIFALHPSMKNNPPPPHKIYDSLPAWLVTPVWEELAWLLKCRRENKKVASLIADKLRMRSER